MGFLDKLTELFGDKRDRVETAPATGPVDEPTTPADPIPAEPIADEVATGVATSDDPEADDATEVVLDDTTAGDSAEGPLGELFDPEAEDEADIIDGELIDEPDDLPEDEAIAVPAEADEEAGLAGEESVMATDELFDPTEVDPGYSDEPIDDEVSDGLVEPVEIEGADLPEEDLDELGPVEIEDETDPDELA